MVSKEQKTAVIWIAVSSEQQTADDKISLSEQETQCRRWCTENGYKVVELLSIDGHSRYESDVIEALQDFAAKGIFGYHRLREYWKTKDIDVLVCYHDSRLGRSASLYTYAIENTIRAGISIYRIMGGWITESDVSVQNAIGILTATADIQRLMKMRKAAMPKRAERGLNVGPKPVFSHKTIYDEKGNDLRVEVDRSKQRLWDDLAALVIEGVSWDMLELELYKRYGHTDTNNKPFKNRKFYDLLHTPMFWGHGAWNYRPKGKPNQTKGGCWTFDPTEPPPDGITLFYGVHEAVYTGDIAEQVKNELRRRRSVISGRMRPNRAHPFSGLLICGECSYSMSYASNKRTYEGYRCMGHFTSKHYPQRTCTQMKYISVPQIRDYVNNRLTQAVASPDGGGFFMVATDSQDTSETHRHELQREIDGLSKQKKALIRKQATAPENLQDDYDEALADVANRIDILENEQLRLISIREQLLHEHTMSRKTIAQIKEMGIDNFWSLSGNEINQYLHVLFGKYRIIIKDGEIVGLGLSPITTALRYDE